MNYGDNFKNRLEISGTNFFQIFWGYFRNGPVPDNFWMLAILNL